MIDLLAGVFNTPPTSTAPVPPPHHLTLSWMALGILVATIITWLVFRWRGARLKRRHNSPRRLWRELARIQRLTWSDRRLLTQLARKIRLRDQARLFLEPELWQQAIDAEKPGQRRKRIAALQAKLLQA